MKKIVIEVYGGCADCTSKPKGVEVVIIDHDNKRIGERNIEVTYDSETEIDH
jgi:hypothetical protein